MIKPAHILAAFAISAGLLHAAIPLKALKQIQKRAPERLVVTMTKVTEKKVKRDQTHWYEVAVEATVKEVKRSAAGIKAGDVIRITYTTLNWEKSQRPGDYPERVKQGKVYEAWLAASDAKKKTCKPAAHSASFEPVKK